ncbi:3-dehydro-L-gulonate 2-dehydrogenase [Granulicella arctica]|uniref:3-dehydro-L-gulonate 2-dehydrogenase n=1 Tax=Granulicella arctica TaxID=940613 RepID=A0A7Y9PIJ8_9BACT|nr:3-dehydro-L-gulonate 2-dehydrogenase [Granulicella arctica]NYF80506.1 3-dehydro-L-gulonate 2-dehydrogenase [Granulicella arctica]
MLRVPFADLYAALHRGMLALGLTGERAELCARLFAETTRDGVYTHGLNRFPRFTSMVNNGSVDVHAQPERIARIGGLERWDAHLGPGNLAAYASMNRAIELSRQHGLGAVALANTTHWMRAGTYGWLAAEAGVFGICWTNTMPNLPPWGATTAALGNNPIVLAVPRLNDNGEPAHIVLDVAMSQFSYGAIDSYRKRGELLPVDGGFDTAGNLTRDPEAIHASQRALPIGYWKGSGLSMTLDLFAAMLSGGQATNQIPRDPTRESGVSQFFLAIDPSSFASSTELKRIADGVLASVHDATPVEPGKPARYPGEQTLLIREENMRLGVPVDPDIWHQLTVSD